MAPSDGALLEARELHARYGEIEAIHGVDLVVERGAIVALLGANGSGKTSTLRALTGAIKTDRRGDVRGPLAARQRTGRRGAPGDRARPRGARNAQQHLRVGEPHARRVRRARPQAACASGTTASANTFRGSTNGEIKRPAR